MLLETGNLHVYTTHPQIMSDWKKNLQQRPSMNGHIPVPIIDNASSFMMSTNTAILNPKMYLKYRTTEVNTSLSSFTEAPIKSLFAVALLALDRLLYTTHCWLATSDLVNSILKFSACITSFFSLSTKAECHPHHVTPLCVIPDGCLQALATPFGLKTKHPFEEIIFTNKNVELKP